MLSGDLPPLGFGVLQLSIPLRHLKHTENSNDHKRIIQAELQAKTLTQFKYIYVTRQDISSPVWPVMLFTYPPLYCMAGIGILHLSLPPAGSMGNHIHVSREKKKNRDHTDATGNMSTNTQTMLKPSEACLNGQKQYCTDNLTSPEMCPQKHNTYHNDLKWL